MNNLIQGNMTTPSIHRSVSKLCLKPFQRQNVCRMVTKNMRNALHKEVHYVKEREMKEHNIADSWCERRRFKVKLEAIKNEELQRRKIELDTHYTRRLEWITQKSRYNQERQQKGEMIDDLEFQDV